MKAKRNDVDIAGPFDFRLYPGSPIYNRLVKNHNIELPETLADYEAFLEREENATFSSMPWAPKAFVDRRPYLHFYFRHAMKTPARITSVESLIRMILGRLAMLRVKSFQFHMPFEYWLMNGINRSLEYYRRWKNRQMEKRLA